MSTFLTARELSLRFGDRTLLNGISFTLNEGERIGLVGDNGSGKSTLGKILASELECDSGEVVVRRGVRVLHLAQEPEFEALVNARDAVLGGLGAWRDALARYEKLSSELEMAPSDRLVQEQADAAAEVDRLGGFARAHAAEAMLDRLGILEHGRDVATMSGGERRRVALARLLVAEPEVAILDEPTNHLDVDTIEWLEEYLVSTFRGGLILITHDRYFLNRAVGRTMELADGALHAYDGGYEQYLEGKAEREALAARTEANRQNFLRRELEWLRRSAPARTTKQKARIDRANDALQKKAPKQKRDLALNVQSKRQSRVVAEVEDLVVELGGRTLIDGLTFSLTRGRRVGIVGANGMGKTTLLRVVLEELQPTRGSLRRSKACTVAYLDQSRQGLDDSLSVIENVVGKRPSVTIGDKTMHSHGYLERFRFNAHQQKQPASVLSGGERARAVLAKMLLSPANLLVLDEPTNDLDLPTLHSLEAMLDESDATALVVTHDRYFLDRIATDILAFEGEGRVVHYVGNYDSYRRRRDLAEKEAKEAKRATVSNAPVAPLAKKKKSLTYGERLELEAIVDKISAAETDLERCEKALTDPEVYEDPERALAASEERDAAEVLMLELMARWEELEAKKEG